MARQRGWKVDGQLEKGENGTPHYQLILKTPQVRFSAVKKAFPRAHIEVARNVQALEQYVKKDETRVSALASSSEKYPSLSRFWILITEQVNSQNWLHIDGDKWYRDCFDFFGYKRSTYENYESMTSGCICRFNQDLAVQVFESCVEHLIGEGYHVEHFFSPPNISVFKKFHFSLLRRSMAELSAQTDRQTDTSDDGENSLASEYTHVSFQEDGQEIASVQVPTLPPPSDCPSSSIPESP